MFQQHIALDVSFVTYEQAHADGRAYRTLVK